jgi:hypothetical protein
MADSSDLLPQLLQPVAPPAKLPASVLELEDSGYAGPIRCPITALLRIEGSLQSQAIETELQIIDGQLSRVAGSEIPKALENEGHCRSGPLASCVSCRLSG